MPKRRRPLGISKGLALRAAAIRRGGARRLANARSGGFLGLEFKFYDTYHSANIAASAHPADHNPAAVDCLSAMAQGDGPSERDGNRCILKKIDIVGKVQLPPSAGESLVGTDLNESNIYMALVLDTQSNGAHPNGSDIWKNFSGSLNQFQDLCMRNLEQAGRFRVLWKKVIVLKPDTFTADYNAPLPDLWTYPGVSRHFACHLKLDIPVQFKSSSAGIASVSDNSLHFFCGSDSQQLAPHLRYTSRVRFVG